MKEKKIKKEVESLLNKENFLSLLKGYPLKQVINPLIGALLHRDEKIRQKAIKALGEIVSLLAQKDMEAARIIMRRFMWMLNEESGGIGWGVPLAMAEIMVRSPALAKEYLEIFLAYIWEEGNYLEFSPIQREVIEGIIKLLDYYPKQLKKYKLEKRLKALLSSSDPQVKALAQKALDKFYKLTSHDSSI